MEITFFFFYNFGLFNHLFIFFIYIIL
ncbi:hypothetical protein Avbf_08512 [Armadillidium vulgare]|nr:hypothetical protein Avbf_08512 [Armadillidium vulgare]